MTNVIKLPAKSAKFLNRPPIRQANKDVRSREYLSVPEVRALVAAARKVGRQPDRDALLITIMFRHAMRVSEAADLKWDDVDFRSGKLNVRRVKGGVDSTHYFDKDELRALRALQKRQQESGNMSRWVFQSERLGPLSERAIHNLVQRAGEVAGFQFSVHPHMLRHAKGFNLGERGIDTRAIQAYMGHADIKSTVIYTAVNASRFRGFERDS